MTHIGRTIYGFCNGFFGSSNYSTKVIEAEGKDWIVARDEEGYPHFADFVNWELEMDKLIEEWTQKV